MICIRPATRSDLEPVGAMIDACMVELFDRRWSGTVDRLAADLDAGRVAIAIAIAGDRLVGFIAWNSDYDLHHCVRGGTVCELYVDPTCRARGVAAQLVAFACGDIRRGGGVFLKGTAVRAAAPLYDRVAWGWDCREVILGGRAFRTFADLAGAPARAIVSGLPARAWNDEP
jgi:GNAT superfamily N-acetyltransferase